MFIYQTIHISIISPTNGLFLLEPDYFLRSLTCVHPFDSELDVSPIADYNQTGRDLEAEEVPIWQILVFPSVTLFNLRKCRNAVGNC